MATLAKMVALVVVLATLLCTVVSLGSPEIEEDFDSSFLGSPENEQEDYSQFRGSPENEQEDYSQFRDSEDKPEDNTRIISGEPACRNQFRHHARIIGDDRRHFGGSLIKPTAILTCGLCARYKKFSIFLGTIKRNDDKAVKVESVWALVHPKYNRKKHYNDVAVILLNVDVPLGKSIWPVKLPSFDEVNKAFTGRRALISGYGKLNSSVYSPKGRLRFAEVTVVSNDLCKRFYKKYEILSSTLCAGNVNTGFCDGDYGGALVIKTGGQYKQIGIASFNEGNCESAAPGAYARVTSFLQFIHRAAGDLDDWEVDEYSYCN